MFLVYRDANNIDVFANVPGDKIDWAQSTPGKAVFRMTAEDYATVYDWANAGHYTGAVEPAQITDLNGKNPSDDGYISTCNEGVGAHWELLGNTAKMVAPDSVQLHNPDASLHSTLTAAAVIVALS